MSRPTVEDDKAIFLETLTRLDRSAVNVHLREQLNWSEERYWRTHRALLDEGAIIRGKGKGGSVSLTSASNKEVAADSNAGTGQVAAETIRREVGLYEPAKTAIETGWIKERGFDEAIVEITNLPGSIYRGNEDQARFRASS